MALEVLGDRVVRDGEGRTFDLATAEAVRVVDRTLSVDTRGAWREACDRALETWRFDCAVLIDYLEVGERRCLEVYGGTEPCVAPGHAVSPDDGVSLDGEVCLDGGVSRDGGVSGDGGVYGDGGLDRDGGGGGAVQGTVVTGWAIRWLPQAASVGVWAALDEDRLGRMKRLFVRATPGAGLTSWLRLIAREARLRGFVPLCPAAIWRWPWVLPMIRDRSVVLLCDRLGDVDAPVVAGARVGDGMARAGDGVACALLALARARVRVCAVVCRLPERSSRPAFRLGRLPVRTLVQAVVTSHITARTVSGAGVYGASLSEAGVCGARLSGAGLSEAGFAGAGLSGARDPARVTLEALARKAQGLPGRFVALLRGERAAASASAAVVPRVLRAAEAVAPYGLPSQHGSRPSRSDMVTADAWNVYGRQARVIREAEALVVRGRWASAIRTLRADIAANQRRAALQPAAVGALALARVHLTRCEIAEADRWCREAGELAARTQDELLAADALHWSGVIALEQADLETSDRSLRMALLSAEQQGHSALQQQVELSLARCLFWQGCIGQMSAACDLAKQEQAPPAMRVHALRLTARRHLARGELSLAGSALADAAKAIDGLEPHEQREPTCALHVDRARLQLAIGDLAQCGRNLDAAAAARPSGMRLARIRLVRMQCDQLACCEETKRRVARLMRIFMQPRTPRLLRLRARYWFEPESRRSAELAAFIDRYGESALAGRIAPAPGPMTASHFRALLQMSHEAGDERALLGRICSYVRRELDAAYVAIHGAHGGRPSLAWSGQTRLASSTLAERVGSTGQFVSPIAATDALEGGVPVRAHDETVGVLICRWVIDSTIDRPLTAMLLPAAADAAAPHVQAVLDRAGFVAVPATPGRSPSSPGSRATLSAPISTPPEPLMTSLLGVSSQIVTLRETIVRTADAPFNVLIEGESGSGKELVARALHQHSIRRIRRFCAVNCAALSDELLEAELFGHARGAFTGALAERIGLFEEAHEGTLFLDEVGELSTRAQAKLLRAIQDGEIRRIGENLSRRVQPRIVAATNRRLHDEAAAGRFRPDLLYRLDVVRIVVPPLRERLEDVVVLARAFWQQALARTRSRATLDPETLAALARYDWPGNVRELQNVIARLAVQAPARGRVAPMALPAPIRPNVSMSTSMPLDRARRAFEEQFVRGAIARAGGQLGPAARDLGLTRQGLTKVLARLGIATADQPADTSDD